MFHMGPASRDNLTMKNFKTAAVKSWQPWLAGRPAGRPGQVRESKAADDFNAFLHAFIGRTPEAGSWLYPRRRY